MTPDPIEMVLRNLESHQQEDLERFASMGSRFESIDRKLDAILEKLDSKASKEDVNGLEERVHRVELRLAQGRGGFTVVSYIVTAVIAFLTAFFTTKS